MNLYFQELINRLYHNDPLAVESAIQFIESDSKQAGYGRVRALMCRRLKHCTQFTNHRTTPNPVIVDEYPSFKNNQELKIRRFLKIAGLAMLVFVFLTIEGFAPTLPPTSQTPTDYAASATTATSVHLSLGNPSNATADVASANNYLMVKPQYALSYNRAKGIPNWVSWQLNKSWFGDAPRQNNFRPDNTLPQGWYQVRPSDYTGSGYDKGHMAPSADRTKTIEDNSATFLMSNMVPQAPDNNQGYWADLEDYARTLVTQQGKELYIIAGSYGELSTIAGGKVAVPARIFKIIVVTDPNSGVKGINTLTRTMPRSEDETHS